MIQHFTACDIGRRNNLCFWLKTKKKQIKQQKKSEIKQNASNLCRDTMSSRAPAAIYTPYYVNTKAAGLETLEFPFNTLLEGIFKLST